MANNPLCNWPAEPCSCPEADVEFYERLRGRFPRHEDEVFMEFLRRLKDELAEIQNRAGEPSHL